MTSPRSASLPLWHLSYRFGGSFNEFAFAALRKVPAGHTMILPMAAPEIAVVILAAGKGTRMRSELAKVLHRAGGRPLLEHVIRACRALKPAQLLVVVGHQADEVG